MRVPPARGDPPILSEGDCNRLRLAVRIYGFWTHQAPDDSEDDASDFLVHFLEHVEAGDLNYVKMLTDGELLHRCAANWVLSQIRKRRSRRSVALRLWRILGGRIRAEDVITDLPAHDPSPHGIAVKRESRAALRAAIEPLKPAQKDLYHRYFELGYTVGEIVLLTGKTNDAISGRLRRLFPKLRVLLARASIGVEELRDSLHEQE